MRCKQDFYEQIVICVSSIIERGQVSLKGSPCLKRMLSGKE